jgi:hypothetical protein
MHPSTADSEGHTGSPEGIDMKTTRMMPMKTRLDREFARMRIGKAWGWAALLLLAIPAAVQAGDFTFTINHGEATITGYTGAGGEVDIPSAINLINPVKAIGNSAFKSITNMTSVTIPDSVVYIDDEAFRFCTGLTNVAIGNGVASIGDFSFDGCTNLPHVAIPDSVTSIGSEAFWYCSNLSYVTIGTGITNLGYRAFFNCTGLARVYFFGNAPTPGSEVFNGTPATIYRVPGTTGWEATFGGRTTRLWIPQVPCYCTLDNGEISIGNYIGYLSSGSAVTIPDQVNGLPVTSIGNGAFDDIYLTSVTIPASVTDIGINAFSYTGLGVVTIPNSVTNIEYGAFLGCHNLESVVIGNHVTHIGDGAFEYCRKLTDVTIPASVDHIGGHAFATTSLPEITIPASVTFIGYYAFSNCTNLLAITVNLSNTVYSSTNGVLFNKSQTTLIQYPGGKAGDYTIPDSVTLVGDYALGQCIRLTNVTIPDSVTSLGEEAFSHCTNLASAIIGNGVTSIPRSAFYCCFRLTSVSIGNSVTSLGETAFYLCTNLTSVTIPNSVTSIGDDAFDSCTSLSSVVIPNSVTNIGEGAFYGCTSLTNVAISDSVTSIENYTFGDCATLTNLVIPNSVTNIGYGAFEYCTSLSGVYFKGDAPGVDEEGIFGEVSTATIYYLLGKTGWPPVPELWVDRPTALWLRVWDDGGFGVQGGQFGFNLQWTSGRTVVMEACTNLTQTNWVAVATNTLGAGASYFGDPEWASHRCRFYRLRAP